MALLGFLGFLAGCTSVPVVEDVSVRPRAVCPGDEVTFRVAARAFQAGRITAAPAPVSSALPTTLPATEALTLFEPTARICETTTFRFKAWNGDEIDCAPRDRPVVCREASASVVVGSEGQTFHLDACSGGLGVAVVNIAETSWSPSLTLESVVNCGTRNVVLGRDGGASEMAPPGGSFGSFAGEPWVGTWSARETAWPGESCAGAPASRLGEPAAPAPPRPPEICLTFTAGCAASDDCG